MNMELTRPQTALTLTCIPLAILFAYEMVAPAPHFAAPQMALARHTMPPVHWAQVAPPAPDIYAAADARPVFNPARQPFVEAAKPDAGNAPPPPPTATLIGVIMDSQNRMALMRVPTSPLAQSFAIGATVEGWQVTEIQSDSVQLRLGANVMTITFAAHGPTNGR